MEEGLLSLSAANSEREQLDDNAVERGLQGRHIHVHEDRITVTQTSAAESIGSAPVTADERTSYRSVLGQLLWLAQQTRADLAAEVSLLARKTQQATVEDLVSINQCVRRARSNKHVGIVIRRGIIRMKDAALLAFGDAAFANAPGDKSQWGGLIALTHNPNQVWKGRYDLAIPISWVSATIKRVVRSTLAAEGYATSEILEQAQWTRFVLAELCNAHTRMDLHHVEKLAIGKPIYVLTDSNNIGTTVKSDAGQVADKRLRIVVSMLRESFTEDENDELYENAKLHWIPTTHMVCDALTKVMCTLMLVAFMMSKRFEVPAATGKRRTLRAAEVLTAGMGMLVQARASSTEAIAMPASSLAQDLLADAYALVVYRAPVNTYDVLKIIIATVFVTMMAMLLLPPLIKKLGRWMGRGLVLMGEWLQCLVTTPKIEEDEIYTPDEPSTGRDRVPTESAAPCPKQALRYPGSAPSAPPKEETTTSTTATTATSTAASSSSTAPAATPQANDWPARRGRVARLPGMVRARTVATQSMTTYSGIRGVKSPRFQPIAGDFAVCELHERR